MTGDGTVVAVAQLALAVGEVDANRKLAADAVEAAAGRGARLVVLPELSDSGYVFESAAEARELATYAGDGATLRQWRALASAHDVVIAGGFCELGLNGRLYNSAAIVDGSGIRTVYRKAHLFGAEKRVFTPGDDPPPVVELPFGNVGLMICYDLEFPEWVRMVALAGADLIAASVNGVFIAVADRCGSERGVDWVGGSVIIGRSCYPLAGPVLADEPAVLTATCDLSRSRDKRIGPDNDLFADRRPHLYTPILL
jgi:predicted amidohydrolase